MTSRVRVSARSRPSPPLYPHFNRPSGFWPCVKSCLVGGSDKYRHQSYWYSDIFQVTSSCSGHSCFTNTPAKFSTGQAWFILSLIFNSWLRILGNNSRVILTSSHTHIRRSSNNFFSAWSYLPIILDISKVDLPFGCSDVMTDFSEAIK